jgi:hypothetical protein
MKISKILTFLFCLFLAISCAKTKLAEDTNPAARSDYPSVVVMKDASNWVSADATKRKIGEINNTGSMLRTFDSKSILLLEKVGLTDKINVGDILGYVNTDLTTFEISHRLIRINSDGTLVFQGDSNDAEDPPVARSAVVWRVAGILYTNGN